ncbi:MAG: hypothetical protein ACTSRG_13680 [Candidatus Helarchaeota archaeon]
MSKDSKLSSFYSDFRKKALVINLLFIIISLIILINSINMNSTKFSLGNQSGFEILEYLLIFNIIMNILMIFWNLLSKKTSFEINDVDEIMKNNIAQELMKQNISPRGEILAVLEKAAYSDPEYARKPIRKWPWREKGKLIFTKKELIFIGRRKKLIISLSEINAIKNFTAIGGVRAFNVCEINYGILNTQFLLMIAPGLASFDILSKIDSTSIKLMEYLQNWCNYWKLR